MSLDLATVLVIHAVINIAFAGYMGVFWYENHKRFSGIGLWFIQLVLLTIGYLLIFSTGMVPILVSLSLPNIMIISSLLILYIGLQQFVGIKTSHIHNYVLVGAFIAFQIYCHFSSASLNVIYISFAAVMAVLAIQASWFLFFRVSSDFSRVTRIVVGVILLGYVLVSLLLIILLLLFPNNATNVMEMGLEVVIVMILYVLLNAGLEIGLILLINNRLLREIKYMSFHDYLTGLYNRIFFEEELDRLDVERNLPLSLVLGDVNGLKLINDSYGHKKGDKLLIKIANVLKRNFRKSDIVSRWGGDEFIILLPNTGYERAEKIVDNIMKDCVKKSTDDLPLSISLGVSTKKEPDEDINKNLKAAEDNMYRKKTSDEKRTHRSLVASLEKALNKKEFETDKHIKRMGKMALTLGKNLKLSEFELNELVMLSALHDIGKISVADNIILKPGRLTSKEWELVKKHLRWDTV